MSGRAKVVLGILLVLTFGCAEKKTKKPSSLPDYDLTNPVMIHLKTNLDEISGIVYYAKDTSIFAINDEMGILYKIYLRKNIKVKTWKFSFSGDYEDLALVDSTFYVLQSNGNLKGFRFVSEDSIAIEDCTLPIDGVNDFETLYFDQYYQKLILVCKDCEFDGNKEVTAYSFNPTDATFSENEFYKLNTEQIENMSGSKKLKFKPSAAAIHPLTKDLYLISSTSKSIVIANRDGKIKSVHQLDPTLFKQPEGLTFTPKGDLIISNESAEIGSANILIFKYKPVLHEKG